MEIQHVLPKECKSDQILPKCDIKTSCRVCLQKRNDLIVVPQHIAKIYKDLTAIELLYNEQLPENICACCVRQLEEINIFIKKCIQNHFLLIQFIELKCENNIQKEFDSYNDNEGHISDEFSSKVNETKFQCVKCEKIFMQKRNLLIHSKECDLYFKCHQNLLKQNKFHAILRYKCHICGKGFRRHYTKTKHLKSHTKENSSECEYNCDKCDRVLSSSTALAYHMKTHTGEKPYSCTYCDKKFAHPNTLTIHTRLHTGETPYVCKVCHKGYCSSSSLKKHFETRHFVMESIDENTRENIKIPESNLKNKSTLGMECKICNKFFKTQGFGTHMRMHMMEKKQYICQICNKTFQKMSHLERHKRVHTGERPYVCEICKKSFTQDGDLKRHILTHTGEKKYQCQHCGKQFFTNGALSAHITIHTGTKESYYKRKIKLLGAKPYLCNICGKSFSAKGGLNIHIRIHTGEMPFVCNYCSKSFTDSSNLKRHIRRDHTKEKPHRCLICYKDFLESSTLKRHVRRMHSLVESKIKCNEMTS